MGLTMRDTMVLIFTTLLISALHLYSRATEITPKAGIVFRHVGEVILSGDSWNLVGELKVASLQEELNKTVNMLNTISNMASTLDGGYDVQENFKSETVALIERLALVQNKVDIFDQILRDKPPPARDSRHRRKRFISFILGVSNYRSVGRLNRRINHLEGTVDNLADELTSFKAKTTTRLNYLETRVDENSRRINELSARLQGFSNFVGKSLVISSMLRSLGLVLENIDSYVVDMLEAIHELLQNRLSPKLVSPLEIVTVLKTAKRTLPQSIRPLTDIELDAVYDYYSYASIQGYATKSSIVFYIKLPLKAEKRHFDLYKPHSLPVFDEGHEQFVEIASPGHLVLVSKLKEKAAELTGDLEECKTLGNTYVCPASFPLENLQVSCTLSLVLGAIEKVKQLCEVRMVPSYFPPVWVRDQFGWYYSVSQSTRVTKVSEAEKTPVVYNIDGTGFIADTPGYYLRINDDEEELFPSDHLGENATVHINETGEVIIPPFSLVESITFEGVEIFQQKLTGEAVGRKMLSPTTPDTPQVDEVESSSPAVLTAAVVLLYLIVLGSVGCLVYKGRQNTKSFMSDAPGNALVAVTAGDNA